MLRRLDKSYNLILDLLDSTCEPFFNPFCRDQSLSSMIQTHRSTLLHGSSHQQKLRNAVLDQSYNLYACFFSSDDLLILLSDEHVDGRFDNLTRMFHARMQRPTLHHWRKVTS